MATDRAISTLQAIQWEIARERERGRKIGRIHVSSHALEGSIVCVPRVSLSLAAREVLVHPNDWERLMRELGSQPDYETPEGGTASDRPVEINGLPIEHSA